MAPEDSLLKFCLLPFLGRLAVVLPHAAPSNIGVMVIDEGLLEVGPEEGILSNEMHLSHFASLSPCCVC